ncbi:MAG: MBL fold metallo-hydrolase [Prevotella sp.]|nr:MBL fold metallo-hydrolase [Prevotella sp.]
MLRFISLGSGSSGNCYLLYTENDALIIDVGVGTRMLKKRLREAGLSMNNIHAVLITHDHADHVKSVGAVSKDYLLPVYATRKVHVGIEHNYCVRHKIAPERTMIIEKDVWLQLGEFRVMPFDVPHDSADNVGYKIEAEGVTFCVMTDVGHVTDRMKQMIGEADYLVIEANYDEEMLTAGPYPEHLKARIASPLGHMSNRVCGNVLAENATERLKHVWLCHLSEENNHPELARKTVEQVLRSYGIVAGKDFLLDVLKRTTPSEVFELE